MSVHKKCQPNRSSRLASYTQHIYNIHIRMSCFIIKILLSELYLYTEELIFRNNFPVTVPLQPDDVKLWFLYFDYLI